MDKRQTLHILCRDAIQTTVGICDTAFGSSPSQDKTMQTPCYTYCTNSPYLHCSSFHESKFKRWSRSSLPIASTSHSRLKSSLGTTCSSSTTIAFLQWSRSTRSFILTKILRRKMQHPNMHLPPIPLHPIPIGRRTTIGRRIAEMPQSLQSNFSDREDSCQITEFCRRRGEIGSESLACEYGVAASFQWDQGSGIARIGVGGRTRSEGTEPWSYRHQTDDGKRIQSNMGQ